MDGFTHAHHFAHFLDSLLFCCPEAFGCSFSLSALTVEVSGAPFSTIPFCTFGSDPTPRPSPALHSSCCRGDRQKGSIMGFLYLRKLLIKKGLSFIVVLSSICHLVLFFIFLIWTRLPLSGGYYFTSDKLL